MSNYIISMGYKKTVSLISKARELSNAFIMTELEKKGVSGLVPSHGEILFALYSSEGKLPMKNIAQKINRTQPTVTILIDKLVELQFIRKEKDTNDARITLISLTQKGKEFRDVFFEISQALNRKIHIGFSELEADVLEKLLNRVVQNFE